MNCQISKVGGGQIQGVRTVGSETENLAALAGTPMKFRFHLRAGSIYAFWVSPDRSGTSHGK